MTEIGHITGLYAFWDELLARHPGLLIDNCAGGGQRIDLEMISRSVPLWRSDVQCYDGFDPIVMQTQTQGLAPWVPLSVGVTQRDTSYTYRSALGAGLIIGWSGRAVEGGVDLPLDEIRRLTAEYLAVRKYLYGDFYPLASCSMADDAWAAWQYDRPDLGEGMALAFRRQRSPFARLEARLSGLDPLAEYDLISHDGGPTRRLTGRTLMTDGFTVEIAEQPGSALFVYKRVA